MTWTGYTSMGEEWDLGFCPSYHGTWDLRLVTLLLLISSSAEWGMTFSSTSVRYFGRLYSPKLQRHPISHCLSWHDADFPLPRGEMHVPISWPIQCRGSNCVWCRSLGHQRCYGFLLDLLDCSFLRNPAAIPQGHSSSLVEKPLQRTEASSHQPESPCQSCEWANLDVDFLSPTLQMTEAPIDIWLPPHELFQARRARWATPEFLTHGTVGDVE